MIPDIVDCVDHIRDACICLKLVMNKVQIEP